jgi:hypothetical protein
MDPFVIALDAIYASPVGRDAVFAAIASSATTPMRVVDKTSGEVVKPLAGGPGIATAVPACMVRVSELTARGVTDFATLVSTEVTFSGGTWVIVNYKPAPQPGGESSGELRLTLRKTQ